MAISITWSATNGGSAIVEPLDHGSSGAGTVLSAQEVHIEHDGINQIVNCGFYLAAKTGVYGGNASALADLNEMLAWGDGSTAASFGGFLLNMDATGSYSGSWPTYSSKDGTTYNTFRTNVGDSAANKILLAVEMGLTGGAGTIQAGTAPDVRFQCRVNIPSNETVLGVRQFEQRLRYTYTS